MKPVEFKEQNAIHAKDQSQYQPLPSHTTEDGMKVTSCWRLTWHERFLMLLTGRVWLRVLTFGQPLQPVMLNIVKPEFE